MSFLPVERPFLLDPANVRMNSRVTASFLFEG
jgi:hypothetical protein